MERYDYIVIGAGPAGLQMGYFLEQAARKYIILEGHSSAGAFFQRQPRHRTLISLNKCYNWFDEPDFNLRYDWNSLLTYDNSIRFPDYSKQLYPHADTMVKYLQDFAEKFGLNIRYNTRVRSIDRETDGECLFILTGQQGQEYRTKCLLMASGAVQPNIPEIDGIEHAEGYETHDIDPERYTNKRVVILGHGNSAFEVANHLAGHAATIQIFTGGRLIKQSWQTHFVGDLRAINNTFLEMNQVKMPHLVSGATITKIVKQDDGTLRLHYDEDVPHWAVPGTMHSVGVYDHVIRATGWKYFDPSLYPAKMIPATDEKSKYPVVSSIWESSVPDLFFIGAAMANNDRKTTPGFIHGFRYNIRTVFHLIENRYHKAQLPSRTFPLTTPEELEALVQALLTRISTTSALFQMFGVLGEALILDDGQAKWFPELPMQYVLEQREFAGSKDLVTVTLELGFDRFPKGTDALTFIHPNDPGGDGLCTAFVHPVFRHYSGGELVSQIHMQSGVFVRYDAPHEKFAIEFDKNKPHHLIYNFLNGILKISGEHLTVKTFTEGEIGGFTPWPPDRREETELPKCIVTHRPEYVPVPTKYQ
jgi:thioredoxin reductase